MMCIMYMMPGPSSDGEFNTRIDKLQGIFSCKGCLCSFLLQLMQEELVQAMQGKWPEHIEDAAAAGPQRYGSTAAGWVKADERQALGEVLLQPGHVIAGVPLFWVVARGTEYKERFLTKAQQ
jgi:hypothetical protein